MIEFSNAVISDRLQALTRAIDSDPVNNGKLLIYGGVRPSKGAEVAEQHPLLATLIFPRPSLDHVLVNTLSLHNPATALIQVAGLATWARIVNGADQFVADLSVGVEGSGADAILRRVVDGGEITAANTMLYAGGIASVALMKLTES